MGKTKKFYAVAKGRNVGIFSSWDECKLQTEGYKGARYKSFMSENEAERFIAENTTSSKSFGVRSGDSSNVVGKLEEEIDRKRKAATLECPVARIFDVRTARNQNPTKHTNLQKEQETDSGSRNKKHKSNDENHSVHSAIAKGFNVDNDGYIEVYTDGACTNNGKVNAKAGIGVFWSNQIRSVANKLNVSEPAKGNKATNNTGEIQAITRSIEQAIDQNISFLRVVSDSKFAIQCVEDWMPRWKLNGWKTTTGNVVNRIDLEELDHTLKKAADCNMIVAFKHVRGHIGNLGNEAADRLAVEGARKFCRNLE